MARVSKVKRIYEEGVLIAKECSKCHEIKPVSEFYKNSSVKDGLYAYCKQCSKEKSKQYCENNKEHLKEYNKQYHENNKERLKEQRKQYRANNKESIKEREKQYRANNKEYYKQYRENNKEYFKQYRENNKERLKEQKKQYYEDNKEHFKEQRKQYRANNKESIKEQKKQYYENNKESIKERVKQYYENNKESIKERVKQWREDNKEYLKQYRENNKEHRKEIRKQWREKNKEHIKQYNENNKEHFKEYHKQKYDNKVQEATQGIYEKVTNKLYPHNGIQYGIIYGVHNTITDRWYIGQTTNSFDIRYKGDFFKNKVNENLEESIKLLVEDIKTYGEESFQIYKVIDVAFSEEELDALEVYYIDKYKAYDKGYNSNRGYINGKRSYREI